MKLFVQLAITFTVLALIILLVRACNPALIEASQSATVQNTIAPADTITPSATITPVPSETATATPTTPPTATPLPKYFDVRNKIEELLIDYGSADPYFLSDSYWQKMSDGIEKYGAAKRILTLEYHGDQYSMFDGQYAMDQVQFEIQMRYLLDNDYHFVTGAEMVGFLEGWLSLPARSAILTTDSWQGSRESFVRITALFTRLESEYGVKPHMNSFIWTLGITPEENPKCENDSCWQFFRDALSTGFFSFGSHTETHSDFSTLTDADATWDINESKREISGALGLNIFSLAWPSEVCSPSTALMTKLGLKFAFGGYTRAPNQLYAYANDDMPLCLPRLLPPNPDGTSLRPRGWTLKQMLDTATNEDVPLE